MKFVDGSGGGNAGGYHCFVKEHHFTVGGAVGGREKDEAMGSALALEGANFSRLAFLQVCGREVVAQK